ncbi:lysozyme 2-like [Palaemon carinicauda]|uniref:lysozyme 2-like n=1 Tax=Palaemon carinicauda TaxID=392227 RepID=UPI0035B595E2
MTGLKIISICVLIKMAVLIKGYPKKLISDEGSDDCLRSICQATTGCDLTAGCHTQIGGAYFCGPFRISMPYWVEAGSPTLYDVIDPTINDFEECTKNFNCSAKTVVNYMQKFVIRKSNDCTGDGVINCDDYMTAHFRGRHVCE